MMLDRDENKCLRRQLRQEQNEAPRQVPNIDKHENKRINKYDEYILLPLPRRSPNAAGPQPPLHRRHAAST